jgi:hypothetical protein
MLADSEALGDEIHLFCQSTSVDAVFERSSSHPMVKHFLVRVEHYTEARLTKMRTAFESDVYENQDMEDQRWNKRRVQRKERDELKQQLRSGKIDEQKYVNEMHKLWNELPGIETKRSKTSSEISSDLHLQDEFPLLRPGELQAQEIYQDPYSIEVPMDDQEPAVEQREEYRRQDQAWQRAAGIL